MRTTCYLGLGSNLGDCPAHCRLALEALSVQPGISVHRVSALYETEPVNCGGSWFLNAVLQISTDLPPRDLLRVCLQIESRMGRVRTEGPPRSRTIDLDILFYGNLVLREPGLEIPHPRLDYRRFVLEPLAEIAPQWRHPVRNQNMASLLKNLRDFHQVRRTAPDWISCFENPSPAKISS